MAGVEAQSDAEWEKRFRREAPEAWQRLAERLSGLQGRSVLITWEGAKIYMHHTYEYRHVGQCAWWMSERLIDSGKPDGSAVLTCVNPKYAFRLRRHFRDSSWLLDAIFSSDRLAALGTFHPQDRIASTLALSYIPSYFGGIRETLLDPKFRLNSVRARHRGRSVCVAVAFVYLISQSGEELYKDGWVVLDPER
ncbi:MAG: hypothetical protein NZM42_14400 [Gemmatales bacterium]|nr:hypothetical protein [Gemmatales bacterium]